MKPIASVIVLGLGKVGHLVARLMQETGFRVSGGDVTAHSSYSFPVHHLDVSDTSRLAHLLEGQDAVISCLPYRFNLTVARCALKKGAHYFDLTEDVATMKEIQQLGRDAAVIMAPQCGLAPGFISIVGASLARRFEKIRSIRLRVGALPKHPTGLLGYAFNWSSEGVVNEYLNDCEVIENGVRKSISPLDWLEQLVIDGVQLEAFTTSGGLGTLCDTFEGTVENLDYKSIRYPGHATMMNFFLHELLMRDDRKRAGEILVNAKPPVNDDVVHVHASVEGWKRGSLLRKEYVRTYTPMKLAGNTRRTIAWTTAASVSAVVELVSNGSIDSRGFLKQEDILLETFLATSNGRLFAGKEHGGRITG